MNTTAITPIDAQNCIHLPTEWVKALGLHGQVVLERVENGIFVRPHPRFTWDNIFGTKLTIPSSSANADENELELQGDDFLF
jgi:hypothetical protein